MTEPIFLCKTDADFIYRITMELIKTKTIFSLLILKVTILNLTESFTTITTARNSKLENAGHVFFMTLTGTQFVTA